MTIPTERTRAVLQTEQFLTSLLDPKETPRVPKSIRQQAKALLRHYPTSYDLKKVARNWDSKSFEECSFSDPDEKF